MSLLLEALKKAEKAKEEAQRRSGETPAAAPLQLEGEAQAAGDKQVVTRTQLPDISAPLEILSDDIAPARKAAESAPRPAPASAPSASSRPQGAPRPAAAAAAAGTDASLQRAAARKVFEAKFKESNPRMPFYITLGVLGVFAVGTAGYFWVQLRPPAPLVNLNPAKPAGEVAVAPQSTAQAEAAKTAATEPAGAIPGLPGASAPVAAAPIAAPATPAVPSAPAARAAQQPPAAPVKPIARLESSPRLAAPAAPAAEPAAPRPAPQVPAKVQSGYAAYTSGDFARAREDYQDALREDASNRDALLGLAALDTRAGRFEAAEGAYLRLLQMDPRDPHAQAGLLALRSARVDPLAAESRVKTLLASDPNAHVLNFALGNQLARQERWAEAQQQYFKAFTADPENADFAYNLAVSLDHLRQAKIALEYYQRALALAAIRGASFDAAAVRTRVAQLAK